MQWVMRSKEKKHSATERRTIVYSISRFDEISRKGSTAGFCCGLASFCVCLLMSESRLSKTIFMKMSFRYLHSDYTITTRIMMNSLHGTPANETT